MTVPDLSHYDGSAGFLVDYRRRVDTRPTPLLDFYIGAHAGVANLSVLSWDVRLYRNQSALHWA